MSKELEIEKAKQSFLTVIKWCSRHAGARVVFEDSCTNPKANVETRVIHMPKKIALKRIDSVLGTVIHEAMHIKHTPKWLGDIARDRIDHTILNGLEDSRIEEIACKQLKALYIFLENAVKEIKADIKDPDQIQLGFMVLCNIACQNSKISLFDGIVTVNAEKTHRNLIIDLEAIYPRIFSVTMASSFENNVKQLYTLIDEFRKVFDLPPVDPSQKAQMEAEAKAGVGNARIGDQEGYGVPVESNGIKPGRRPEAIDLEEINHHLIDLNEAAKNRIKETLKKSMSVIVDEGLSLNTDNLCEVFTGNIDDLFQDTNYEKKMRTKVYFLMDVSGSMNTYMKIQSIEELQKNDSSTKYNDSSKHRSTLAVSAFGAIAEVLDECRDTYGTNIEYENFVFSDDCQKVNKMTDSADRGGGTKLPKAVKHVINHIQKDDPANKRILVILTDGDVGSTDILKEIINKEAQDIRIVFVGIAEAEDDCDLIKHNIMHEDHGEAKIIEAMEEAL